MRRIDRTGQRYGRLRVTGPAPSKGKHTYWHCLCECGKTVTVASSNLSNTLSCGCGREHKTPSKVQMRRFGNLLPMVYIPKIQVPLGDRELFPKGFWLCRCRDACNTWVRASTTQLRRGLVVGCEKCSAQVGEESFDSY